MEKPKIKQVHLVAEMENGDIKQFGLTVKQRITLNEWFFRPHVKIKM